MPALPIDTNQIVITASRVPESEADTAASVSILDSAEIERLDEPLVANLLRLTPSAAVTSIGPSGSLTEVRIRGAEANLLAAQAALEMVRRRVLFGTALSEPSALAGRP